MTRYPAIAVLVTCLAILACTVSFPSAQGITGSGDIVTLQPQEDDFERVVISHAFEATLRQGETYNVTIRIDDNLQEYLRVVKVGQTLEVGLDLRGAGNLRTAILEAEITLPALSYVEASGASRVSLVGFGSDRSLEIDASGASSITGEIQAGDARVEASGASSISLSGRCSDMTLDVSGASSASLQAFECQDVGAVVSGASDAEVYASGRLDADVSGASKLEYAGDPALGSVDTTGSSTIQER